MTRIGALWSEGESMSEHGEGEEAFLSIGERLRRAREERAMTLDDVATQTRIPMRHLQHIEAEEWDALPAPTYAIGFARNYANAVGLDGAAIGNELRDRIGGPRRRAPAPEYYEPADPARTPPKLLVVFAIVLAILLAGGYLIWRNTIGADPAGLGQPDATVAGNNDAAPENAAGPQDAVGQTVTLTAVEDVWLQVSDNNARPVLFERVLNAGESFTVPADVARPMLRTRLPHRLRVSVGGRDLGLMGSRERLIRDVSLLPQDLVTASRDDAGDAPAAAPGTGGGARPQRPRPAPAARPAEQAPAPAADVPAAAPPSPQP